MLPAMTPSDPSVTAVLAAAQDKVRATAAAVVIEVANSLLMAMKSAGTYRELGQAMANAMPACYAEILAMLKQRGLKPTDLSMRPADDFSARPPGRAGKDTAFDDARTAWEVSWQGRMSADPGPPPRSWENSL